MTDSGPERLTSGKAVAAALLLAGVLLATAAVFLFVVFERACASRGTPAAYSHGLRTGTASI